LEDRGGGRNECGQRRDLFAVTKFGEALIQQGLEQGREQGREQGLEQGREQFLIALLRDRFGSHPGIPAVSQRLAGWPSAASVHAITAAATLDDLLNARPPT
jgi:hypothetical protein